MLPLILPLSRCILCFPYAKKTLYIHRNVQALYILPQSIFKNTGFFNIFDMCLPLYIVYVLTLYARENFCILGGSKPHFFSKTLAFLMQILA